MSDLTAVRRGIQGGVILHVQSGPDWTEAEVRGWWKDRLFVKIPDSFCDGGEVVELNRKELKSKRFTSHNGYTYFTPDGKEKEDAENAKTIAAGQMAEVMYVHYYGHEDIGGKFVRRWRKQRVFNMNKRWIFFYWNNPVETLAWVEKNGLDSYQGAFAYPDGIGFYSEDGLRAKEKHDEEWEREHAHKRKTTGEAWILAEDAIMLGISINSTEAQVLAAFRKLARVHHPDAGGTAEGIPANC